MRRSRFTEEQIISILAEHDARLRTLEEKNRRLKKLRAEAVV